MNSHIILVKMRFGSHLYGTATPDSDTDYKGVFMPSKRDILLGSIVKSDSFTTGNDKSRNTAEDVDTELYSLHYFIKLAKEGQTVALDMLHAPDEMLIHTSPTWRAIVRERHRFYTCKLNSFITYARRQASKYGIKGSRLHDASRVLQLLQGCDPEAKMQTIWQELPRTEHCTDLADNPAKIRQYQICGKTVQETSRIGYVIPMVEKFINDYGHRARLAARNENIDWKAISHALRAGYQIKELFTCGRITFPLPMAEYLTAVKLGKLDYRIEVAPKLEALMDEVEKSALTCGLPEEPDHLFWDDFLCNTVEHFLRNQTV